MRASRQVDVAFDVTPDGNALLNRQRLFGDSGIPYAFVTIAVPAGSVLLIMTIVVNAIEAVREAGRRGRLVFTKVPIDEEAGL